MRGWMERESEKFVLAVRLDDGDDDDYFIYICMYIYIVHTHTHIYIYIYIYIYNFTCYEKSCICSIEDGSI